MFDKDDMLQKVADCVVMLTWSDWFTEPRSNRYHYAMRLSKHFPVIFVQADLWKKTFRFETTETANLLVLHVYKNYGVKQTKIINRALLSRGLIQPILWVYNCFFYEFITSCYAPLKIYHATEDYFSPDLSVKEHAEIRNRIQKLLCGTIDLLVCVSDMVLQSYMTNCKFCGISLVLTNGCDYTYWSPTEVEKQMMLQQQDGQIVFYQGGINSRIDFNMLLRLINMMPDWEFWFCGRISGTLPQEWNAILAFPNVTYFGEVTVEVVRRLAYQSTVGIIPYIQNEFISVSFPLKAFEYVSTGLPVVSVPIAALQLFPGIFTLVTTVEEFCYNIKKVSRTRRDAISIEYRLEIAESKNYDYSFEKLCTCIKTFLNSRTITITRLNVLILYDEKSTHIPTIREYLESYDLFSRHKMFFTNATGDAVCGNLTFYDVIVVHYSIRVSLPNHLSPSYAEEIQGFGGLKVLYIQDDYENTEQARNWIETLGINIVFTVVPEQYIDIVYPRIRFPYVKFINILTGYISSRYQLTQEIKPIADRGTMIAYRGRPLAYWYGDLGQEKIVIGQKMKQICEMRNIPVDIEWTDEKRIYGDAWYQFLSSCKATLASESGSNVFDDFGIIKDNIQNALKNNPSLTYQEIHEKFLQEHEGKVIMNQISPKVFEAIQLKTALVMFEGTYSNILLPHVHYIPLKKDFSNVDEVLEKLHDDVYLQNMVETVYNEIVLSGKFSYERFIKEFDDVIAWPQVRDFLEKSSPSTYFRSNDTNIFDRKRWIAAGRDIILDKLSDKPLLLRIARLANMIVKRIFNV